MIINCLHGYDKYIGKLYHSLSYFSSTVVVVGYSVVGYIAVGSRTAVGYRIGSSREGGYKVI